MNQNKKLFPTKEMAILTAVLYSVSQNCFHIEKLHEYVEKNIQHAMHKLNKSDWKLIGVFNNDMEAHEYIETFKRYQKEYDERVNAKPEGYALK